MIAIKIIMISQLKLVMLIVMFSYLLFLASRLDNDNDFNYS